MANKNIYIITQGAIKDIADAVREKLGSTSEIIIKDLDEAIGSIQTGITPTGSQEITENGTYNITEKAQVVVVVPNTYAAADEGKVVDDGALVSQTSTTVTENGTVDTTTNNEVVVNVSGEVNAFVGLGQQLATKPVRGEDYVYPSDYTDDYSVGQYVVLMCNTIVDGTTQYYMLTGTIKSIDTDVSITIEVDRVMNDYVYANGYQSITANGTYAVSNKKTLAVAVDLAIKYENITTALNSFPTENSTTIFALADTSNYAVGDNVALTCKTTILGADTYFLVIGKVTAVAENSSITVMAKKVVRDVAAISGTQNISQNGTYDVSSYASVVVNGIPE